MERPRQSTQIPIKLNSFELKVIQHLRSLENHGFGTLDVRFRFGKAYLCERTFGDDPSELAALQSDEGSAG